MSSSSSSISGPRGMERAEICILTVISMASAFHTGYQTIYALSEGERVWNLASVHWRIRVSMRMLSRCISKVILFNSSGSRRQIFVCLCRRWDVKTCSRDRQRSHNECMVSVDLGGGGRRKNEITKKKQALYSSNGAGTLHAMRWYPSAKTYSEESATTHL